MDNIKPTPRTDILGFLDLTRSLHDGRGGSDFVDLLKKGIDKAVIGKLFGDVSRQTAWSWANYYEKQHGKIKVES